MGRVSFESDCEFLILMVQDFGKPRPSVYINFKAAPDAQKFVDGSRLNQKQKKKYFEEIRFEIFYF